jgi:hypothetical protein
MAEHLIEPAGAIIRSIDIQYYIDSDECNRLIGLRFKDKDANTLLLCGEFNPPSNRQINHTIDIKKDERVVGVRSKTSKDGGCAGYHFEIEFLLWKQK